WVRLAGALTSGGKLSVRNRMCIVCPCPSRGGAAVAQRDGQAIDGQRNAEPGRMAGPLRACPPLADLDDGNHGGITSQLPAIGGRRPQLQPRGEDVSRDRVWPGRRGFILHNERTLPDEPAALLHGPAR